MNLVPPLCSSLVLALVCCLAGCQSGDPVNRSAAVVRVDGHAITVAEFDQLADQLAGEMPLPGHDPAAVRQQVLEVVLAREALLLEGERRGLDTVPEVVRALRQLERELVIDRLYEAEVSRRAEPAEAQLDSLYQAWDTGEAVRASHILCATEDEAWSVLDELGRGADFAQLARARSQHALSAPMGGDMGYMRREQLLPEMRDPVWQAPVGKTLPAPIRTRMGHHVVRVTDHRRRTFDEMRAELAGEARRALKRQRELELGAQLRDRYRFRWDQEAAGAVVAGRLTAGSAPNSTIAAWDGGALTVGQFIQYSRAHGRRETEVDTAEARQLGEAAALRGLLWRLGRDRRLSETTPEISGSLRRARAERTGEALYDEVAGKVDVSTAALRQAHAANRERYRRPPILRVQEILVDDRPLADSLVALVRGGADMGELAARFTRRVWAAPRGGDIGEITEGMPAYTKMARVARGAPVGRLVGPIPSHGGYSIFRVTARQEGQEATFEESREAVARSLRDRAMDAFIDSLRQVFAGRIQVDEDALAQTLGGAAP
jgi:peptidyl-prolyl cis-trans isomerase C